MMDVYLLWHTHTLPQGEDDSKLIGVYSTQERAEEARERAVKLPGFKDAPDGFEISPYRVDEDNWHEGFITEMT